MKNLALPFVSIFLLFSCKKETKLSEDTSTVTDSTTIAETSKPKNTSAFAAVEYTPEQTSKLLNGTENDTLYITNFFATWCGPCIREIPHFKEKMEEMKGQPVKFTFISLDEKTIWDTDVKNFVEEHGIAKETILLDGNLLNPEFFSNNFKTWKGETIPFTYLKKGDKTQEINGSVTKEELETKINSFN